MNTQLELTETPQPSTSAPYNSNPADAQYVLRTGPAAVRRLLVLHDIYGPAGRRVLLKAGARASNARSRFRLAVSEPCNPHACRGLSARPEASPASTLPPHSLMRPPSFATRPASHKRIVL